MADSHVCDLDRIEGGNSIPASQLAIHECIVISLISLIL